MAELCLNFVKKLVHIITISRIVQSLFGTLTSSRLCNSNDRAIFRIRPIPDLKSLEGNAFVRVQLPPPAQLMKIG